MKTRIFWGSSYDRGLDILLKLWPKILTTCPTATLDICYGWNIFERGYANNPERMSWKKRMDEMMKQKGITHHGRIGRDELKKVRQNCDIWAYCTYFPEINCITALECQSDGLVPVVMNFAALQETVQSGIKIDGDIYDEETQDKFIEKLLGLMQDDERWKVESKKAKEFAGKFTWDNISLEWEKHL
jgi:glycosyltransferase involved in cell wall biosynthesis